MIKPFHLSLAILIALVLTILPIPSVFADFRPPWVLLVILYSQFFLSNSFPLLFLLVLGVSLDILLATIIGEHIFALVAIAWITTNQARRFQLFLLGKQMAVIGVFCFIYQLLLCAIDSLQGLHPLAWSPLIAAFMGILFWPWVKLLLDDMV